MKDNCLKGEDTQYDDRGDEDAPYLIREQNDERYILSSIIEMHKLER